MWFFSFSTVPLQKWVFRAPKNEKATKHGSIFFKNLYINLPQWENGAKKSLSG
jgi:hypothetical protein